MSHPQFKSHRATFLLALAAVFPPTYCPVINEIHVPFSFQYTLKSLRYVVGQESFDALEVNQDYCKTLWVIPWEDWNFEVSWNRNASNQISLTQHSPRIHKKRRHYRQRIEEIGC